MQHAHITRLSALALGIAGALAFGQADASGFQLKENSVKSLGNAFAGAGLRDDDASVVVNNPASMTQFEGTTIQGDVTAIDLNYEFRGDGYDALGRPLTGGDGGNAGDFTPIPAFSLVHKFDNGAAIGAMFSAPFGLATKYDPDWVGRYAAIDSDVQIVELALTGAVDIIPDRLSVGVGLTFSQADVTLSKGVDFGSVLAGQGAGPLGFHPQSHDGEAEIQGDDTGMGWILGVNIRPTDKLSIGISHRSEVKYDLRGDVDWTLPAPARAAFDSFGAGALFQDGGAGAKLTTPGMTTVEVAYQFTDRFSMAATYAETSWESLEEVRIEFDGPDAPTIEPFGWGETRFSSIGGEFVLNDAWTLRAGYAYDETPTTFAHRTPRLPDEDRQWYSIGATWNYADNLEFSFAYTRLEPDTPYIGIEAPNYRLFGEFEGAADLYGISAQYRF